MKVPEAKVVYWWDWLFEQFWFVPIVYAASAVLFSFVTLQLDEHWIASGDGVGPNVLGIDIETTADSARIVLGSIIGGLVTVFGLTVSITMLSVSQTSSQYGPRLVRSITSAAVTQNVVGLMIGTIILATVVLRSIRNGEAGEVFVPNLSVLSAELGAAVCLVGLLAHTSHVMRSMRAESLIQTIYAEVRRSMEAYFGDSQANDESTDGKPSEADQSRTHSSSSDATSDGVRWLLGDEDSTECVRLIRSEKAGYLQAVDIGELTDSATSHGVQIKVATRPGNFVQPDAVMARVYGIDDRESDVDSVEASIRSQFLLGMSRTPRQDLEAGMLELVEVGVRALSPGVNDPFTAIIAIDFLSSLLRQAAEYDGRDPLSYDSEGIARVRVRPTTFVDLLDTTYDPLRQHAAESVPVLCRLLEGLEQIAERVRTTSDLEAIRKQTQSIERQLDEGGQDQYDLDDLRERLDAVEEKINERNAASDAV